MVPDKKALEAFNPPATNMWKAAADLLTQGVNHLPHTALLGHRHRRARGSDVARVWNTSGRSRNRYLPSAMGLGLAWVVPFQNAFSFLIGAVIVTVWQKLNRKNSDTFAIPIASGLIAGESLVAAFIAIACTLVGFLAMK